MDKKEMAKDLEQLREEKSADLFVVLKKGRAVDLVFEAQKDEKSSHPVVRKIVDNEGWICLPVAQPRNTFEERVLKVECSNTRKIEQALEGVRGVSFVTTNGAALSPHFG